MRLRKNVEMDESYVDACWRGIHPVVAVNNDKI